MPKFLESVSGGLSQTSRNVFRTRLISEGQGSSGFYSAEMLKRDVPKALPKGTKVYFDHMSEAEMDSGRARSMDGLVGVFDSDPEFVEADGSSWANIRFYENNPRFSNIPAFIEEAMADVGVSIEVHAGVLGDDGVVQELGYSPHNSLAVVTTPGARGKIEGLMESFRSAENHNNNNDGIEMDKAEMLAILNEANKPVLEAMAALAESLKPAEEEKPVGPTLAESAEAVAKAGLTEAGRAAVYALVESGMDLEKAVEMETKREASILEALKESEGSTTFRESGSTKDWNEMYERGRK